MSFPRIYSIHDQALTIEFSQEISEDANMLVIAFQHAIESAPIKGFIESVPAFGSITVYVDVDCNLSTIKEELLKLSRQITAEKRTDSRDSIIIPVCYDTTLGFDLNWVADYLQRSAEEIIALHVQQIYRVYMIGFIPGFPYMGILPEELHVPRKQTPSMKIPMGSVAIAGKQTGIYPAEVPGGWHVIGRTPLKMFDKTKEPCSYLNAGDMVQFKSITLEEFNQYS